MAQNVEIVVGILQGPVGRERLRRAGEMFVDDPILVGMDGRGYLAPVARVDEQRPARLCAKVDADRIHASPLSQAHVRLSPPFDSRSHTRIWPRPRLSQAWWGTAVTEYGRSSAGCGRYKVPSHPASSTHNAVPVMAVRPPSSSASSRMCRGAERGSSSRCRATALSASSTQ